MFWIREVVGWVLVGLGLLVFAITYFVLLRNGHIFESVPMAFIGFIIFRGGIHLVKVAVAARICQQAAAEPHAKPARSPIPQRALFGHQAPRLPGAPVVAIEVEDGKKGHS
jgi:hypothetical protein